ncbi:MAG TPA: PQQ-dependent sugar dehydrogenase, partial [Phototrophicaceae bacterium]|nr:PQQ-dependent sugar dehydrogenase [Phototrophicaceae bacterium]
ISIFGVGIFSLLALSQQFDLSVFELGYAQNIRDPALSLNSAFSGFSSPTGIAFLNDIGNNTLVIEKKGNVRLVSDGLVQESPIHTFNVDFQSERGLLGVEVLKENGNTFVFFYLTERSSEPSNGDSENLRHRVYSFAWDGNKLTDQALLLDLPALPGPNHDGGKITIGKDGQLYVVIGDLNHRSKLQNMENGNDPDLTGSIFRINPLDGNALPDNPFIGSGIPNMDKTFGYGIRNSYGLTSDPITGTIWDTENGPDYFDEINIVYPGFNSGWRSIMGPVSLSESTVNDLVVFPNSRYSDPIVSWPTPIAITDIEFINTPLLGAEYQNNILVGDHNLGNLYFLKVNEARTGLDVSDAILDSESEIDSHILGEGFGSITDIETGPDGKMYIVSLREGIVYTVS